MPNQELNENGNDSEKNKTSVFSILSPITKSWTDEIEMEFEGKKVKSKQRFFEATVSGLKEDRHGEIMDQAAIDDMIQQFKSGTVPLFPDHGFDAGAGIFSAPNYSWKKMMGVWEDARQENDKLIAVARLNNAHPDADLLWNYLQQRMPVGFSIGGKVVSFVDEDVGGDLGGESDGE